MTEMKLLAKRVKELEKENAELNDKLNLWVKCAELRLAYWQKYKKENTELQHKVDTLQGYLDHDIEYDMDKKFTKATELLKQTLPYLENLDEEGDELYDGIEQFIKEIEE